MIWCSEPDEHWRGTKLRDWDVLIEIYSVCDVLQFKDSFSAGMVVQHLLRNNVS